MTIRTISAALLLAALLAPGCYGDGDLDFSQAVVDSGSAGTDDAGADSGAPVEDVAEADAAPDAGQPDTVDAGAEDTGAEDTGALDVADTGGDAGGCEPVVPYGDVQAIFDNRCSGCHVGGALGGLSLDKGADEIVSVPALELPSMNRIEPGDPSQSYLWLKLTDQHEQAGGSGGAMPLGGNMLPQGELDTIEAWILGIGPNACP
jgi:hypothetical protein